MKLCLILFVRFTLTQKNDQNYDVIIMTHLSYELCLYCIYCNIV